MRAFLAAVGAAVLLATVNPSPAAAASEAPTFAIVNSASYEADGLPRGALVSIFTSVPVTNLDPQPFSPWQQVLPDGLSVEASCGYSYDQPKKLPISYIGRSGSGHQINLYYPNDMGDEPWGHCAPYGGSLIVIRTGPSHGYQTIAKTMNTIVSHPGVFFEGPNVPAGDHVAGLYPYPRTRLLTCVNGLPTNPALCRTSTIGVPATIVVTLTGAEFFVANPGKIFFEIARLEDGVLGSFVRQSLVSIVNGSQGTQVATIGLLSGTQGGEYRLRVTNSEHSQSNQLLTLKFGPPI